MVHTKGIYRPGMIIRVLGIMITCFLILYVVFETYFWLASFWIFTLLVVQIIEFIRFAERSRYELITFLNAISENDFSTAYSVALKSKLHDELTEGISTVQNLLITLRDEKEKNHQYLKAVVEHINIAIVCFNHEGRVQLYNRAAELLFQKRSLTSIKSFEKIDVSLAQLIKDLKPNQRVLARFLAGKELLNLSMRSTSFIMGSSSSKIVSFQDISDELNEKEIDSWQKLISVISHEINNSVIPISTLSHTLCEMLEEFDFSAYETDLFTQDIRNGLKSIESRSKGLVDFVQSTHKLRQIPDPEFRKINGREMFSQVSILVAPLMKDRKIVFDEHISNDKFFLLADQKLIEQTLINLLMNAIEATENTANPVIHLKGFLMEDNRPVISVIDNGSGIVAENLEKVFIPYFTTKPKGTGIGLSIARRIMQLHHGSISVHSDLLNGTEFLLKF